MLRELDPARGAGTYDRYELRTRHNILNIIFKTFILITVHSAFTNSMMKNMMETEIVCDFVSHGGGLLTLKLLFFNLRLLANIGTGILQQGD